MIPRSHKYWLWFLLSVPGAWIVARYALDIITYGKVLHETGWWSAWLVIAALAVTPLRLLAAPGAWSRWLAAQRRALGVASFGYGALHTLVYLQRKAEFARIITEAQRPELATGWVALVIFAALAITSNDRSVRYLRRNWKRLHRLVYLGAALMLAHWYLAAFNQVPAVIAALVVVVLEAYRLARKSG